MTGVPDLVNAIAYNTVDSIAYGKFTASDNTDLLCRFWAAQATSPMLTCSAYVPCLLQATAAPPVV